MVSEQFPGSETFHEELDDSKNESLNCRPNKATDYTRTGDRISWPKCKIAFPTLTECDEIPNNCEETPTPQVAPAHPHLHQIADEIPELDKQAEILLLFGQDVHPLHKAHESRNGSRNTPWGQQLDLGRVVLRNTCLMELTNKSRFSCVRPKWYITADFHCSCRPNRFHVRFNTNTDAPFINCKFDNGLAQDVFMRTPQDNKPGTSTEDRRSMKIMEIMENGMTKDENGSWDVPLSFRHEVRELRDEMPKIYLLNPRQETFHEGPVLWYHAENFRHWSRQSIPEENLKSFEWCWYLPHFGIYHPKKPDKIRVVFDSAAKCNRISLNSYYLVKI